MNLLEGSIAFALAIAAFATLCTVLIEILHRLLRMRSAGLKQMLEGVYDEILAPRVDKTIGDLREDFLDQLTDSPLLRQARRSGPVGWIKKGMLKATELSPEDLLRRLPRTRVAKQLKLAGEQEAQALLEAFVQRYEEFGAAGTDYFRRRAKVLSIIAGIALAVVANVHAVRLFDAFVSDQDLAARIQSRAEHIEMLLARQPSADTEAALKEAFQASIDSLDDYRQLGLPIGWDYFPYTPDAGGPAGNDTQSFFSWLLGVLLTGLFIGLGGPFWFDVAVRLSRVRRLLTGQPAPQGATVPDAKTPVNDALQQAAARMAQPGQEQQR